MKALTYSWIEISYNGEVIAAGDGNFGIGTKPSRAHRKKLRALKSCEVTITTVAKMPGKRARTAFPVFWTADDARWEPIARALFERLVAAQETGGLTPAEATLDKDKQRNALALLEARGLAEFVPGPAFGKHADVPGERGRWRVPWPVWHDMKKATKETKP